MADAAEMQDDDAFSSLPEPIQRGIKDLGWTKPTPVQTMVIPAIREKTDLIVQSQTGSGKTGAFGIPIAELVDPELAHCQALVMTPTRELANQVAGEVTALGRHRGIRTLAVYGGVGYAQQIEGMEAGAHVVVGTPGRILDHLGSGRLDLSRVRCLVLDEADELLSLGFWPDMREINKYLPDERQSCLFSATIPERVRSLSRVFLKEPRFVSPSNEGLAPQEIAHFYVVTTAQAKDSTLLRILEFEAPESAIIFCNTKDDVRFVTAFLQRRGFDADQISGDLTQVAREKAMARIKAGELRFLVATDVAARGIDISDLSHVISYSAPQSTEVYIHRTGRTGRAGKAGVAISLVSGLDIANFNQIQKVHKIVMRELPVPTEEAVTERLRERLMVKIEQELRALPERDRREKTDRFVPVVEGMAASDEGKRDLAAICAAYMQEHRPETTVDLDAETPGEASPPAPEREDSGGHRRSRRGGRSRGGGGGGRRRRR
jgi:ATP-dependent RNA helicase DeaD